MTTFDGSTGGGVSSLADVRSDPEFDSVSGATDTLDLLRERVQERQSEEFPNHLLDAGGIRLSCRTVIDFRELQKWREQAIPKAWRNKKLTEEQRGSKMDMRQFFTAVFVACTEEVEVLGRDGRTWKPITNSAGQPLTLAEGALNNAFGVMDVVSLVRKLWRRDADLMHAGNELLAAAGWTDEQVVALHEGGELPDPL